MKRSKIPEVTIKRLSQYSRCLEKIRKRGEKIVSATQLANLCMVSVHELRKDLYYFGRFGIRGAGYHVKNLLSNIKQILGSDKEWRMAVIGIGNLGSSVFAYKDFLKQDYKIVATFDIDPLKVIERGLKELGKPVEIIHINRIREVAKERKIEIGIITTPPSEAQNVADLLVQAKVRGILNFAPVQIIVPEGFVVKDVSFTRVLDNLVYILPNK